MKKKEDLIYCLAEAFLAKWMRIHNSGFVRLDPETALEGVSLFIRWRNFAILLGILTTVTLGTLRFATLSNKAADILLGLFVLTALGCFATTITAWNTRASSDLVRATLSWKKMRRIVIKSDAYSMTLQEEKPSVELFQQHLCAEIENAESAEARERCLLIQNSLDQYTGSRGVRLSDTTGADRGTIQPETA